VLPANTFTDALGLKMTFLAFETSGPNVTSWLHFNTSTDTFSGAVPANASGTIGLLVLATDTQGMMAEDMFSVSFVSGSSHVAAGVVATPFAPGSELSPQALLALTPLHS